MALLLQFFSFLVCLLSSVCILKICADYFLNYDDAPQTPSEVGNAMVLTRTPASNEEAYAEVYVGSNGEDSFAYFGGLDLSGASEFTISLFFQLETTQDVHLFAHGSFGDSCGFMCQARASGESIR